MRIFYRTATIFASAILGAGLPAAAQADVLTFEGNICNGAGGACADYGLISQSYGDTAFVDVQYNRNVTNPANVNGSVAASLSYWRNDYNDLVDVAWGDSGGTSLIFLKPTAGYQITLNSFDLGAYPDTTRTSSFTILDGLGNVLTTSGGPISVGFGSTTHNTYSFNLTSATGIAIQWGPDAFNVGIDNVDFTVSAASAVPEPAAWAMMIGGFGLVGATLRRRQPKVRNMVAA